jgi:hypothetical protein
MIVIVDGIEGATKKRIKSTGDLPLLTPALN